MLQLLLPHQISVRMVTLLPIVVEASTPDILPTALFAAPQGVDEPLAGIPQHHPSGFPPLGPLLQLLVPSLAEKNGISQLLAVGIVAEAVLCPCREEGPCERKGQPRTGRSRTSWTPLTRRSPSAPKLAEDRPNGGQPCPAGQTWNPRWRRLPRSHPVGCRRPRTARRRWCRRRARTGSTARGRSRSCVPASPLGSIDRPGHAGRGRSCWRRCCRRPPQRSPARASWARTNRTRPGSDGRSSRPRSRGPCFRAIAAAAPGPTELHWIRRQR